MGNGISAISGIMKDTTADKAPSDYRKSKLILPKTSSILYDVKSNDKINFPFGPNDTSFLNLQTFVTDGGKVLQFAYNDKGSSMFRYESDNGTFSPWFNNVGPKGDRGATGDKGSTGDKGNTGDRGAVGPQGPQGLLGPVGPQGNVGAVGPVGPVGPLGPLGPVGPQGIQGIKGDVGAVGPIGPQGIQGIQGVKGDVGGSLMAGSATTFQMESTNNVIRLGNTQYRINNNGTINMDRVYANSVTTGQNPLGTIAPSFGSICAGTFCIGPNMQPDLTEVAAFMKAGDANNQISNLVGNYDNKESRGFDKPPAYYKSQNKMSSTYYTILQGAAPGYQNWLFVKTYKPLYSKYLMQVAHSFYNDYSEANLFIRHENDKGEWGYWVQKNLPSNLLRQNMVDSVIYGANVDGLAVLSTVTVMDASLGLIGRIMQAANENPAVKCVVIGTPAVTTTPLNPPDTTEQSKYFIGSASGGKHTFTFYSELPSDFTVTPAGNMKTTKLPYASTTTNIYYKSGSTIPIALKHAPVVHGSSVHIDGGWKISGDRSAADKHFRVYNKNNDIVFTAHDAPAVGAWSFDKQLVRSDDTVFARKTDVDAASAAIRSDATATYLNKNKTVKLTADFYNSALTQGYKNYGDRPVGVYDNGSIAYGTDKPQNAQNHIPFKLIQ